MRAAAIVLLFFGFVFPTHADDLFRQGDTEKYRRMLAAQQKALGLDPNKAAENRQIAKQLGVPQQAVEDARDFSIQEAAFKQMWQETEGLGTLRGKMADPEFHALAKSKETRGYDKLFPLGILLAIFALTGTLIISGLVSIKNAFADAERTGNDALDMSRTSKIIRWLDKRVVTKTIVDAYVLVLFPLFLTSLIVEFAVNYDKDDYFNAMQMAIFMTAFAYFVIAGFGGAIKRLLFGQRMVVYFPVLAALSCYWLFLTYSNIDSGYMTLFGLVCAIILTIWRFVAINKVRQA